MDTGWLSRPHADVPPGEEWLGENERRVSAHLKVAQRRADWRLGRWTAKAALGLWLGLAPSRFEVLAAPDGAPEAWLDGERVPVSVSLSHRGGRALAVVSEAPGIVGCDLELLEPRSGAFVREWLAPGEQRMIYSCGAAQRVLLANLFWAAKEACTKVRRQGLALNVRRAVVTLAQARPEPGQWCPLRAEGTDRRAVRRTRDRRSGVGLARSSGRGERARGNWTEHVREPRRPSVVRGRRGGARP